MGRRLVNVTLDNLDDLPSRCRACVFWELDSVAAGQAVEAGDAALEKEAWVSEVLLEWGSCGKVCYVDSEPVGYVLYTPPAAVPRSRTFPTSPVSADAVLLTSAFIEPAHTGGGLGRMLVQAVAKDLVKRNVRAIEAFGDAKWQGPACLVPAEFLLAVGFKTVRPHHRYPRLRLDLRTALTWRADVEEALSRLLGSMQPQGAPRPV